MALNQITQTLNVHQSRADVPTETAAQLKALFDQDVNTVKAVYNSMIAQLESLSGASLLGATNLTDGVSLSNIQTELESLLSQLQGLTQGSVADGSITDAKLSLTEWEVKDLTAKLKNESPYTNVSESVLNYTNGVLTSVEENIGTDAHKLTTLIYTSGILTGVNTKIYKSDGVTISYEYDETLNYTNGVLTSVDKVVA